MLTCEYEYVDMAMNPLNKRKFIVHFLKKK